MREVRMTFGEHLEELRKRIIAALLWLSLTTIICFVFGKGLMKLTMGPHESAILGAMTKHNLGVIENASVRLREIISGTGRWEALFAGKIRERAAGEMLREPTESFAREVLDALPGLADGERAALGEAIRKYGAALGQSIMEITSPSVLPLEDRGFPERFQVLAKDMRELAGRVEPGQFQKITGLGFSFEPTLAALDDFNRFLLEREKAILDNPPTLEELERMIPGDKTVEEVQKVYRDLRARTDELANPQPLKPKLYKYIEGFMSYFKVCLIFGIFFALPMILFEMWKFIGAGLYEREQRYVLIFFPFSIALFLLGTLFGYFWLVPFGLEFLASWGTEFADPNFTLENYIHLFFTLTILLGLVFQTPLVMIFLSQVGLVTSDGFRQVRKYTLLGAVIFATLVTPPDPLSWSMVAGPVMLLYELGIRICTVLERRGRRAALAGEDGGGRKSAAGR